MVSRHGRHGAWFVLFMLSMHACFPSAATGEEPDAFIFYVYGGLALPSGDVAATPTDGDSPSVSASDVYEATPSFGMAVGLTAGNFFVTIIDFDLTFWSLSDSLAGSSGDPSCSQFSIGQEYGRWFGRRSWFAPFGAASWKYINLHCQDVGSGTDQGLGIEVAAGVDVAFDERMFVRLGARYQPVSPGFGGPNDLLIYVGFGGRSASNRLF